MASIVCPICEGAGARRLERQPQDYEYWVETEREFAEYGCPDCASEFLYPRPTAAEVVAMYPAHYHAYHDDHGLVARALVGLRARTRARSYARFAGEGGRLFDVGAGDCRHFEELRKFCRLECAGVEIQPEMAARARERGYDVATGTLEEMDVTAHVGGYDIVSMNHLIEHVVDPRLVFEKAWQLLKPGGTVLGQLPCKDSWEARLFGAYWAGYHYPRHLQVFTRAGLRRALEAAGFGEQVIATAPHLQTALSVQNLLVARGWRPRMQHGKTPVYSVLLLGVLPFEGLAYLSNRGGIIDFRARKPVR